MSGAVNPALEVWHLHNSQHHQQVWWQWDATWYAFAWQELGLT
jgi:hypothetical protein